MQTLNDVKFKSSETAKARMCRDGIIGGRRVQPGKTAKDRANGARQKNLQNKQMRADYQNSIKSDGSHSMSFPWASCNGKRNRYQVTGPKGQTIYLGDKKK